MSNTASHPPASPVSFSLPLLDRVQTAAPCHVRWDDMTLTGDDRTRHCDQCSLHVHDVSKMTKAEAEAFLFSRFEDDGVARTQQRTCALIYRRADGTILTADCPVGLAALRAKARRALYRVAAVLGLTAVTAAAAAAAEQQQERGWSATQPFAALAKLVGRVAQQRMRGVAGGIIIAPPPAPPRPSSANAQP